MDLQEFRSEDRGHIERCKGCGDRCCGGQEIVTGREVTSYNVGFDFGKFLYHEPWNLRGIVDRKIDIMKLATSRVYELFEGDSLADKELQERLLREREESYYPEKWVRSIDAYRALCPEDSIRLEKMIHRAIDDAVMEGWILKPYPIIRKS